MHDKYNPAEVEAAAQAHWQAIDAYRVTERADAPKFYACSMLPYPSGKLHMGHVRNYTINDMMARQLRMKGYNVLMPMGWDAFGLPAENAAIDKKVAPARWTRDNIADMKAQMQPLGLGFDWSREVATCDPAYYKWNQWLFLKMLEAGVAERRTQLVNWDPVDNTVLANEQVVDGKGWRSGAVVEKREIPGYYLKITDYAEELLAGVADPANPHFLAGWPERVRLMQEHWIGKSQGMRFYFPHAICDAQGALIGDGKLQVFTTRADTVMGVTFCAVAAEHPIATRAAELKPELAPFIAQCLQGGTSEAEMATKEKEGRPTGLFVTHPLTQQPVEVWIGNYVLMGYGDGAVMGVPAHDERDFAFAKKYGLEIRPVVAPLAQFSGSFGVGSNLREAYESAKPIVVKTGWFSEDKWDESYGSKDVYCFGSHDPYTELNGLSHSEAIEKIATWLGELGVGEKKTTWRLRDWGISRQRYWGTPIPIIHCESCGPVPVPYEQLPVVLPEDCIPDGSGNPLNTHEGFHAGVTCPRCGAPARRETDTMDTFVDSAWYFMRYCDPTLDTAMVGEGTRYWSPMDQYIGGIEHAVMHLLYARFWTKVMRDMKLVDFSEPFKRLFTQGMLLNESYFREDAAGKKRWYYPEEVTVQTDDKGRPVGATANADGLPVQLGGIEKMSKSKNNVVEPRSIIERHGADTARLFTMFAGPPQDSAAWSHAGVEGAHRYLRRLWAFAHTHQDAIRSASGITAHPLRFELHRVLQQVSADYERLQYNTVISGAMKLLNALEDAAKGDALPPAVLREGFGLLLRVLYPACPHITHALWGDLGFAGELLDAPWPEVDAAALVQDEVELVLQVNGKLRGTLKVAREASKAAIEAAALAHEEAARFTEGRPVKKVVVVPGRLVNVVA